MADSKNRSEHTKHTISLEHLVSESKDRRRRGKRDEDKTEGRVEEAVEQFGGTNVVIMT